LIHVILFNELEIRKRVVRGEAHDQAVVKYGGVAGHSGLFSTSDDVTRFMRIMLNKGKLPELTSRVLPEVIVEKFITKVDGLPFENSRSYGFDTTCPGSKMSDCFRLDGSTGIVAAGDKSKNIIITILSNRSHPDIDNNKFELYKGKIADMIMTILGH